MCEIISYPTFYTQAELLSILKFNFRILIGQTFSPTAVCAADNAAPTTNAAAARWNTRRRRGNSRRICRDRSVGLGADSVIRVGRASRIKSRMVTEYGRLALGHGSGWGVSVACAFYRKAVAAPTDGRSEAQRPESRLAPDPQFAGPT